MNIETGKVYTTDEDVAAARQRNEPLMKLTPAQQKLLGIGRASRLRRARRAARKQRQFERVMGLPPADDPARATTK